MFWQQIQANRRRTIVLFAVFALLVAATALALDYLVGRGAAFFAAGLGLFQGLVAMFAGDKLALSAMGAREATKEEAAFLVHSVEGLAIAAEIPRPRIVIVDDPMPNAFATGLPHKEPVVGVTTGLLSRLERQEIEGVLAHEVAHIANHDTRVMTIAFVLAGIIALIGQMGQRALLWGGGFGGGRRRDSRDRGGAGEAILLLLALVGIVLAPLAARLITLAVSRNREYLADAEAVRLTRNPQGLIGALAKIGGLEPGAQARRPQPNLATAHMWFAHPLRQKDLTARFLSTHPPIEQRIERLRNM